MSSEEVDPIGDAKVLLIEDSRDHQFLFLKRLGKIGLKNIIVCETGELGVEKIKSDPSYDLVLVDYSLPGKSGIDVIREIKILNPEIPVIMITGLGSEKIAVQAMKLGIKDYLTKDDFLTTDSIQPIVTQILLEHRVQQEMILSKRLKADPSQLSVSVYKFGNLGPEPFLSSPLPFEELVSSQEKDNFLIKLGAHYMTATGAGHEYSRGLFELPVPNYEKYHGLVFGFRMMERSHNDDRIKERQAENYGLIVIIFPVLFRSILPIRSTIEKRLSELLSAYSDMGELDNQFITRVKNMFFELE
ncbi:MAG: response regulator [Candidatus Heimdallarchaeota archaeon]|nr:MAG: response regulator [Candidatus Heimdallarchaeota archaeon]